MLYMACQIVLVIYMPLVSEKSPIQTFIVKKIGQVYTLFLGEISSYPGLVTLKNNPVSENMELKMT